MVFESRRRRRGSSRDWSGVTSGRMYNTNVQRKDRHQASSLSPFWQISESFQRFPSLKKWAADHIAALGAIGKSNTAKETIYSIASSLISLQRPFRRQPRATEKPSKRTHWRHISRKISAWITSKPSLPCASRYADPYHESSWPCSSPPWSAYERSPSFPAYRREREVTLHYRREYNFIQPLPRQANTLMPKQGTDRENLVFHPFRSALRCDQGAPWGPRERGGAWAQTFSCPLSCRRSGRTPCFFLHQSAFAVRRSWLSGGPTRGTSARANM